ncbi:MAG TPA: hypothetical protein VK402_21805 [Blastococcus sp.]|nr:hypothetical protein [Blastococcus sp.]
MIVLRSLAGVIGIVVGLVLLVLGLVLAPVLLLLAPLPLLAVAGWKFWRLRRQAEHKVKRGRRRARKFGKKVRRSL